MKTVVDTYAWVEIFKASSEGRSAKEQIEGSDEAFTPDIVLAELAAKYLREGEGLSSIRGWLQVVTEATFVLRIDIPTAEESAKASLELNKRAKVSGLERSGLADAVILATARVNRAKLLTGDPHFRGLPETIWLGD